MIVYGSFSPWFVTNSVIYFRYSALFCSSQGFYFLETDRYISRADM